jgi:hypothetical protein
VTMAAALPVPTSVHPSVSCGKLPQLDFDAIESSDVLNPRHIASEFGGGADGDAIYAETRGALVENLEQAKVSEYRTVCGCRGSQAGSGSGLSRIGSPLADSRQGELTSGVQKEPVIAAVTLPFRAVLMENPIPPVARDAHGPNPASWAFDIGVPHLQRLLFLWHGTFHNWVIEQSTRLC